MAYEIPEDVTALMNSLWASIVESNTPKHRKFPKGFRYRYYGAAKRGRHRLWLCCWTTTRNENGKFVSFVYEVKGKRYMVTREVEHRRRNAAKARALRLSQSRTATVRAAVPVVQS
jgi:hypothetical protein